MSTVILTVTCSRCSGSGQDVDVDACPKCNGDGCAACAGGAIQVLVPCPDCGGRGEYDIEVDERDLP